MIEIVYNEGNPNNVTTDEMIRLPNNIRQIGECKSNVKIYLEDYAYTYLKRLANECTEKGSLAILLGEAKWQETQMYVFVKGVLAVEVDEIDADHIEINEAHWSRIYQEIGQYYDKQSVIGWSLLVPGLDMRITDAILQAHLKHFAGNQKVLFAIDSSEREEAFFVYDNGKLKKQSGYYIFYEKNEQMQAYMIEKNGNRSIENEKTVSDRAVVDFRSVVSGRKAEEEKRKKGKTYLKGICAAAAVLVLGMTWGSHQNVQEENIQETVQNDRYAEEITEIPANIVNTVTPKPEKTQVTPTPTIAEEEKVAAEVYQKYVVKHGDTLTKISEVYYGDIQKVQEICEINELESEDLIYTGQIILLP